MIWNRPPFTGFPQPAPNGRKWNFLVLFGDDWPLDLFNEMPSFNATYASSYIDFPNAVAELPLCFPARASFQTGQSSRFTTVTSNDDGATYASSGAINYSLPVVLQRAGYYCGWVGKIYNGLGEGGGWGSLPWFHPGINYMAGQWGAPDYFDWDELTSAGTLASHHNTTDTNAAGTDYAVDVERLRALTFLGQVPSGHPWFLCWPSKACHQGNHAGGEPEPPSRYASTSVTYTDDTSFGALGSALGIPDWINNEQETSWTSTQIDANHFSHRQALRVARAEDEALCAVLAQIEARGETQNTVVMLCTDNAIAFGNLRLNGKGTPHRSGMNMVLKIKVPGVSAGTCYAPVCVYDLAPTIAAMAGARMLYSPYGMSIHPLFADLNKTWREAALITNPNRNPRFWGLKFGGDSSRRDGSGRTHYHITAAGGNSETNGGWIDPDQTTNVVVDGDAKKLDILRRSVS